MESSTGTAGSRVIPNAILDRGMPCRVNFIIAGPGSDDTGGQGVANDPFEQTACHRAGGQRMLVLHPITLVLISLAEPLHGVNTRLGPEGEGTVMFLESMLFA